jgi:hypothetical protein
MHYRGWDYEGLQIEIRVDHHRMLASFGLLKYFECLDFGLNVGILIDIVWIHTHTHTHTHTHFL